MLRICRIKLGLVPRRPSTACARSISTSSPTSGHRGLYGFGMGPPATMQKEAGQEAPPRQHKTPSRDQSRMMQEYDTANSGPWVKLSRAAKKPDAMFGREDRQPRQKNPYGAGVFKARFYADPYDRPSPEWMQAKLRSLLELTPPNLPAPEELLDTAHFFLGIHGSDPNLEKTLERHLVPLSRSLVRDYGSPFTDRYKQAAAAALPVTHKMALEVLSRCFVLATTRYKAAVKAQAQSTLLAEPTQGLAGARQEIIAVSESFARYCICQTLFATTNDRFKFETMLASMNDAFRLFSTVESGYKIGVPLVAAWTVLRVKLDKANEPNNFLFQWPKEDAIVSYIEQELANLPDKTEEQKKQESQVYVDAVSKLYRQSGVEMPKGPKELEMAIEGWIEAGKEDKLVELWMQFRAQLEKRGRITTGLFNPSIRNTVLATFLTGFKAPLWKGGPAKRPLALENRGREVIAMAPKPIPIELLEVLMRYRPTLGRPDRVSKVKAEVEDDTSEDGTQVLPLGTEEPGDPLLYGQPPTYVPVPGSIYGTKRQVLSNLAEIWESAEERSVRLYMLYMAALGKLGEVMTLQRIWNQFVGDAQCKAKYLAEAGPDARFPPTRALNQMISSAILVPETGVQTAFSLFEQAIHPESTVKPDIITINIMLRHWAKMSDTAKMEELFKLADSLGLQPDTVTYMTLVQGLLKGKHIDLAKAALSQMDGRGIKPDPRMFQILVADLARDGSQVGLQHAEELMDKMRSLGYQLDVFIWTSLISGYFKGNWQDDAWNSIRRMELCGVKLNRVGYNMVLKQLIGKAARAPHGKKTNVLTILEKMVEQGDAMPNSETYVMALMSLVEAMEWDNADEVIKIMNKMRFDPVKSELRNLIMRVEYRRRASKSMSGKNWEDMRFLR